MGVLGVSANDTNAKFKSNWRVGYLVEGGMGVGGSQGLS